MCTSVPCSRQWIGLIDCEPALLATVDTPYQSFCSCMLHIAVCSTNGGTLTLEISRYFVISHSLLSAEVSNSRFSHFSLQSFNLLTEMTAGNLISLADLISTPWLIKLTVAPCN